MSSVRVVVFLVSGSAAIELCTTAVGRRNQDLNASYTIILSALLMKQYQCLSLSSLRQFDYCCGSNYVSTSTMYVKLESMNKLGLLAAAVQELSVRLHQTTPAFLPYSHDLVRFSLERRTYY